MSAVQAASVGLRVLVVEMDALGGKPVREWRPEDPLVMPSGFTAEESGGIPRHLAGLVQAAVGFEVVGLDPADCGYRLSLCRGFHIHARSVVIATGARDRCLDLPDARYDAEGLHYVATGREAALCVEEEIMIVGGGTAACRAAVFLGGVARQIEVLVRGNGLSPDVPEYLCERIHQSSHINVRPFTTVVDLWREGPLNRVVFQDAATGEIGVRQVWHVFIMIGAVPNTAWLAGSILLDDKGFIRTGKVMAPLDRFSSSSAGVFAIGDVRSGSANNVSGAIGEGIDVVADIKRHLGGC